MAAILDRLSDSIDESITSVSKPPCSCTQVGEKSDSIRQTCCDWTNTVDAPFSVLIYADGLTGYTTDAELEPVLDPWIGNYLRSGTTTPDYSTSYPYDYLVTNVTCD